MTITNVQFDSLAKVERLTAPVAGRSIPSFFRAQLVNQFNDGGPLPGNPYMIFLPAWVPPGTTQVQVILSNVNRLTGAQKAVFTTDLAVGQINNAGNAWAAAPTVQLGLTVQGMGTKSQVFPVTRNPVTGMIGICTYLPAATATFGYELTSYGLVNTNSNAVGAFPGPAGLVPTANAFALPIGVSLEYPLSPATDRLVIVGDSLMHGLGPDVAPMTPGLLGSLYQLGPSRGTIVDANGIGGQQMQIYGPGTNFPPGPLSAQTPYSVLTGSRVLLALGTNGGTVGDMIDSFETAVCKLLSYQPRELWLSTVAVYTGSNFQRLALNSMIRAGAMNTEYVLDIDAISTSIGDPRQADGIHWPAAMYTAIIAQLVADGKV